MRSRAGELELTRNAILLNCSHDKNMRKARVVDTCKCMSPNDGLCMRFNLCKKGSTDSSMVRGGKTVV